MIGILGAMQVETEQIKKQMQVRRERTDGILSFTEGIWMGQEVVVATCGIGKVSAAMGATAMILGYHPELLINTGVAGGVAPGLALLDLVIAEATVQHDMDTTAFGDPKGEIPGLGLVRIPCDTKKVDSALQKRLAVRSDLRRGIVASGDQFISDRDVAARIHTDFDALAVDMESGSIGQVCYLAKTQCLILRAISDSGDDMEYQSFVTQAAGKAVALLSEILREV